MKKTDDALAFLEDKKSKQKPKEKGRGQYRERECPYCHSMVRNLPNHIKLKHPAESKKPPEPGISKESLLSGKAPAKEHDPASNEKERLYYCINCHAELRKGENPCWNCGVYLNWEDIG